MATRKTALQSLWHGVCNVYMQGYTTNDKTGRDEATEVLKLEKQPCRLSFESIQSTGNADGAPIIQQTVKLFIDSALDIPAGAKIVATQNGVTNAYARSGEPAIYKYHQEIMLIPFEDYA